MKIGIFDSGIGGITVFRDLLHEMPDLDYIYVADTLHVPYGPKRPEVVKGYVDDIVSFMMHKGIDALVIACNTATSIAVKSLREKYDIPIIGMEPAIKPALSKYDNDKKVIVLATELTLQQDKFNNLVHAINGSERLITIPAPGLVSFAENKVVNGEEVERYLNELFIGIDLDNICGIVLGCTHFLYFKQVLQAKLPKHIHIIDGNIGTIKEVKRRLDYSRKKQSQAKGNIEFYYGGQLDGDQKILYSYLNLLENKS